jgi:hypothetical protein
LQGAGLKKLQNKLGKIKQGAVGDQMDVKGLFIDVELFNMDSIKELPDADKLAASPSRYRVVYQDSLRG